MVSSKNYVTTAEEGGDYINILLLGETGVGKSTFINSFANYVRYSTLEEAQASETLCIIPTKFTVNDEHLENKTIYFGEDDNEGKVLGHSSTQEPKTHVFPMGFDNKTIRIIDTPGIGDSRGLEQDEINFENIMNYITRFDVIHAICFLLKPNVSVITPYFKFCIRNLLSRLDKSAKDNIVFVFTNTRSTFYRPAETLVILRGILKDIETGPTKVIIPCNKKNIFSMDNEAFRFLISLKSNYKFGEKDFEAFSASWNKSVEACQQLFRYVVGDEHNDALVPHPMQNIISINEARRVIADLSKPMADISQMLYDNLIVLNRHKKEMAENTTTIEDLMEKLYIPAIDIIQKELPYPVTVCTAPSCSHKYEIGGITKQHYNEICHSPSTLKNAPTKLLGPEELLSCDAMSGETCVKCGCSYKTHMIIHYETDLELVKIADDTVINEIKTEKYDDKKVKECATDLLDLSIKLFQIEKKKISKFTAKFSHFLTENSIIKYNDAYEEYLTDLIQNEENLSDSNNSDLIESYKDMLNQYNQEKQKLNDNMKSSETSRIRLEDVIQMEKDLYDLPISGDMLRSLQRSQKKGRIIEYKSTAEKVDKNELNEGESNVTCETNRSTQLEPQFKNDVTIDQNVDRSFDSLTESPEIVTMEKHSKKTIKSFISELFKYILSGIRKIKDRIMQ